MGIVSFLHRNSGLVQLLISGCGRESAFIPFLHKWREMEMFQPGASFVGFTGYLR
jgi:hypothetical protein